MANLKLGTSVKNTLQMDGKCYRDRIIQNTRRQYTGNITMLPINSSSKRKTRFQFEKKKKKRGMGQFHVFSFGFL